MNDNSENHLESKYTWNDIVVIKNDAPNQFHPGKVGVICGMSEIKSKKIAKQYLSELGQWIYTVEFENGSDIQVPENYLEK